MTLKEIAAEAGVSISTVSRVINKSAKSPASQDVQDRIWEIVRRTGYTPNNTARQLKMGGKEHLKSSHSIACLFARIQDSEADTFFTVLARSIEKEAFKHNYILKYSNIDSSIRPVRVCSENKKFAGITRLGGKYILLDRSRAELFEWEPEENDLKKIDVDLGYGGMETENEEGDACPVGLVSAKDKVIIMLAASSYLYLMDAEYRIEKIALSVGDIAAYDLKWHYMCYEFDGRNLYLPVCYENRILVIDTETWEQKTVEIHLDNESEEIAFMDAMTAEKPVTENDLFYSLEHFISRLTNT